ncbi:MAG: DUF2281 domain-containing protein [Prevotellaceae bacterium]|jgi:hypothetical protein|nr:DUF2281 domain-containing protein [Prevotellaceae bacterium]
METSALYQKIHRLPLSRQKEVSDYVEFLLSKNRKRPAKKPHPRAGYMKGTLIYMSDDFNEPLEDFKEYM